MNVPTRTFRPRSHLAPFVEGSRAWLVLVKNAIPVAGLYWLDWSIDVIVLQIWFAGATALGAMLAFQVWTFVGSDPSAAELLPGKPPCPRAGTFAFYWLAFWSILGLPYWVTMLILGTAIFEDGFWGLLVSDRVAIAALFFVLASNAFQEFRRGYHRMSGPEIRLEFDWEFHMHLARIVVLLLVSFVPRPGLIIWLALALSYVEIYPMRTLRFLGGARTLETANEDRSRD